MITVFLTAKERRTPVSYTHLLLYLVRESAGRQTIKEGLARISDGDLNYKIALTDLKGDNLEMAEAVNHVGEGLQNAVQKSMKSERLKACLLYTSRCV